MQLTTYLISILHIRLAHIMQTKTKSTLFLLLLALVVGSFTACSNNIDTSFQPAGTQEILSSEAPNLPHTGDSEFIDNISILYEGMYADYEHPQRPEDIEIYASDITTGTIISITDGPVFGRFDDDFSDINSVIIAVQLNQIIKGSNNIGDVLYVFQYNPLRKPINQWSEALVGLETALYTAVSPDPTQESTDNNGIDVDNWFVNRPRESNLHIIQMEGMILQISDNTLYWPQTGVSKTGTLVDTLPGGHLVGNNHVPAVPDIDH